MATPQVVTARIRGFLCLNAHPDRLRGQRRSADPARPRRGTGRGIDDALVIGSSTGYGLSSLITTTYGYGARALGVCLERAPNRDKPGSAGWYNLAALHRRAKADGLTIDTINGDAYSNEVRAEAIARLKKCGRAPEQRRVQPGQSPPRRSRHRSVVYVGAEAPRHHLHQQDHQPRQRPGGARRDRARPRAEDVEPTVKVMGGEDWALWIRALLAADLLADGCRTVAYSYVGPELTTPIYRSGTIGKAKEHLEQTARALDDELRSKRGRAGARSASNKALVTQSSSAIPVVPLYISILYKVMKANGTHEGTIEQIVRLFRDHLAPNVKPVLDDAGRVRVDDWEMAPDVQAAVMRTWSEVTSENLFASPTTPASSRSSAACSASRSRASTTASPSTSTFR